jgi:hypothetical protein
MRFTLGTSTVTLLLVFATAGFAQDTTTPRRRPLDAASPTDRSAFKQRASAEAPDGEPSAADEVIQRMIERVRPIESRLRDDHRLRKAESLIGLGVVAYETMHKDPRMPLGYVGTQALRMGLHRQLTTIRQRSGFEVEPSIGHRSFAVTFRKTIE